MTKEEFKEKVMPIIRHFGFVVGAALVGVVIQTGNDYLVPALQEALPNSKVLVPMVTTGFGFLAGLYAKSPIQKKSAAS